MALTDYHRKVIVLVSDGIAAPALGTPEYEDMITKADAFKQKGGIIIGIGVDAGSAGYALLSRISTPGYFLNVQSSTLSATLSTLSTFPARYCGASYSDLY